MRALGWTVAALWMLGCGGDTSSADVDGPGVPDDGPPDSARPPNTTHHGLVQGVHQASGSQLSAGFYDTPAGAPGCTWSFAGSCSLAICSATSGLVAVDAGPITVTIDGTARTLTPDVDARYPFDSSPTLPPGTALTFTAPGGGVGPLSSRVFVMPSLPVVTAPADGASIDRTVALPITWTATTGRVAVAISQAQVQSPFPASFERSIRCDLDAAAGAAEIPAELLGQLEPGMIRLVVATQDRDILEIGAHEVTVRAVAADAPRMLLVQ